MTYDQETQKTKMNTNIIKFLLRSMIEIVKQLDFQKKNYLNV
jgi:hypothetical protein